MNFIEYDNKHFEKLCNYLGKVYGNNNGKIEKYVNWKYFLRPSNEKSILKILLNNDQISGFENYMPLELNINGDLKAHYIKLDSQYFDEYNELINDNSFDDKIVMKFICNNNEKSSNFKYIGKFQKYYMVNFGKKNSKVLYNEIFNFTDGLNYNSDFYLKYSLKKSISYLNWRYFENPNASYKVYSINKSGGKNIGYFVIKIFGNKCYIMDLHISQLKYSKGVIQTIKNVSYENKCKVTIFSYLDNDFRKNFFSSSIGIKNTIGKSYYFYLSSLSEEDSLFDKNNRYLMLGDIM